MTAHSELVARLKGASEGSRELDAAIWYAVHEPDVDYPGIHTEQTEQGPREVLTCELGSKWADDVGRYTTSLDAALALAERLNLNGPCDLHRSGVREWGFHFADTDTAYSPTPALSVCIAIVRAMEGRAK